MKKNVLVLLLLGFVLVFNSCKKDSSNADDPTPTDTTNGLMTATVNGKSWKSSKGVQASMRIQKSGNITGRQLAISGIENDQTVINLLIIDQTKKALSQRDCYPVGGKYVSFFSDEFSNIPFDNLENIAAMIYGEYVLSGTNISSASSGISDDFKFNVTACDATRQTVSGTFSGTIEYFDGKKITVANGKFENIKYKVL